LLHTRTQRKKKQETEGYMCVIFLAKSLCVKGCTTLFKAKRGESCDIFGVWRASNYVWYMLYCFAINLFL
jgi:hypothetical protein